ncbi:glycosyltransferase [Candidatus Avelusimicrobium sp.]
MKQDFSFSVLMSVYAKDRPLWLAQALDSVLQNSLLPKEIVVVTDGPIGADLQKVLTDFTQKSPLIRLLPLDKNVGLGAALNKGLSVCSCPWVARMDADDISLPGRFAQQISFLKQNTDIAVLGGWVQETDSATLTPLSVRRVPEKPADILKFLKKRCPFNHMSVMFKKSAVTAVGGYQPFYLLEDYYLWARLAAAKHPMANLPNILVNARVDEKMYARRGGWKYFKSNCALSRRLRQLGLISWLTHGHNVGVRFCVQVLLPNSWRGLFYRKVLR